jgi:hypothetical protein
LLNLPIILFDSRNQYRNPTNIVVKLFLGDGSFTDAPGTYVTANATASARIHISN